MSLSRRLARAVLELGDITGPLRERVRSAKAEMLSVFCDESDVETWSAVASSASSSPSGARRHAR